MKLNKFFMLGLAGLAFAACSNNDELSELDSSKEKSVEVSIANATYDNASSRSLVDGFTTGTNLAVTTADKLKFLLLAGDRIQAVKTTNDATVKQATSGNNVYTFHNVDGSVNGMAIIGNTNVTINANASYQALLESIKNEANLTSQQPSLDKIVVHGKNTVWTKTNVADDQGHQDNVYSAGQITVNPLLARLEVGQIGCKDLGGTANAEGAIPLYKELTLAKIGLDNIKTDFSQATALTYADTDETVWKAATNWCDVLTDVLSSTSKDAKGTYAYNVVPGTTPRIILQIDSYKANDGIVDPQAKFPWYVRANQYTGLNGHFEAGKIYQVKFQFNCDNIKPWKPVTPICVEVEVIIPNWTIVELTPQFQ